MLSKLFTVETALIVTMLAVVMFASSQIAGAATHVLVLASR
jgi:hypothetical protein